MSQRTTRWYVLGREGGRYVILGWSRDVEAADARVAKLTRKGQPGYALAATDRASARKRAKAIFGITVAYLKRVPVPSEHGLCSLRVRNIGQPGWAMSDNCGSPADTMVHLPNGHNHYRCPEHRGIMFAQDDPRRAVYGERGSVRDYTWRWVTDE